MIEAAALLAVVLLAAYLRLWQVADNPGWYADEATHVDIARHLLRGEVQYLAVNQSTLLFARPPLFHLLLAGWFRLLGADMAALRAFTGGLGVVTVVLLYTLARRGGAAFALLAAGLLAIFPAAVLYSRFGFSYNLLAPLLLLALIGLERYAAGRRYGLQLAALAVGLGVVSDLALLTAVPVVLLVALARRHWRDTFGALLLLALPFGLYALVLLARAPEAFWFDLQFTLLRLNPLSPVEQIINIARNYTILMSQDFWLLAGVIGLWLLPAARLRGLALLMFWLPFGLMGRTVALYSLSFYYLIPLLPLMALGTASLVWRGIPYLWTITQAGLQTGLSRWYMPRAAAKTGAALVVVLVIVSPFAVTLALTLDGVQHRLPTAIDPFLINPDDARRAAAYVNQHTKREDVVIASPAVAWQVNAHAADFQMAVAAEGEDTPHLPGDLPADRLAFDPRFAQARYVMVDNVWRNWGAVHIPGVARALPEIERWPLVFETGALRVYENPAR